MARIVVVDDDPIVSELTVRILELTGHSVAKALDGDTGLKAIRDCPPDLVITDMAMLGRDGVELIHILAGEYPDIPVVAMSGAPDSAQFLYLDSYLGAERLLTKPFTPAMLLTIVDAIVPRPPTALDALELW
jgi:CheY-like chemotaxis protein